MGEFAYTLVLVFYAFFEATSSLSLLLQILGLGFVAWRLCLLVLFLDLV